MLTRESQAIQLTFRYKATIAEVWNAITVLDEMHQWYFENIPDFKAELGFKTSFHLRNEDRDFTHQFELTEVNPMKKLAYSWTFLEHPGKSISTFKIEEDQGDYTQLTIHIQVLEDFPTHIPEFQREACVGGWNYFLGQRLMNYFEKS